MNEKLKKSVKKKEFLKNKKKLFFKIKII